MEWTVDRGFLPVDEPLISLPITDYKQTELIYTWENLAQIIPHYLKENCLREELIFALRKANTSYYHGCIDSLGHRAFERVFLLQAYFATSYVNSPEGIKKQKLPKEIAIPFSRAAHLVSRNPVFDYNTFILYNWKKTVPSANITGNVEPLVTFTDSAEEKLFISTLVEMEYMGRCFHRPNPLLICDRLKQINSMLSQCSRDYIKVNIVDVFFQDFDNLFYEGWLRERQSFKCKVFSESPFLAYLRNYLDKTAKEEYRYDVSNAFESVQQEAEILFRYLSFKD